MIFCRGVSISIRLSRLYPQPLEQKKKKKIGKKSFAALIVLSFVVLNDLSRPRWYCIGTKGKDKSLPGYVKRRGKKVVSPRLEGCIHTRVWSANCTLANKRAAGLSDYNTCPFPTIIFVFADLAKSITCAPNWTKVGLIQTAAVRQVCPKKLALILQECMD